MRKLGIQILCFAGMLFLTGCGSNKIEETTLSVDKKGGIELVTVTQFPESKYSLQELTTMIQEEKEAYNSRAGAEAVILKSAQTEADMAYVDMAFADDAAYSGFSGALLFTGTISQAYDADYGLEISLKSADGSQSVGKEELMAMPESHILILEENLRVRLPGKVLYMSEGVEQTESKNEVSVSGDALHYIVYE